MVEIINEPTDGWDLVVKKDNIVIYKTFKNGNDTVFVKGEGVIFGINKEALYSVIFNLIL
jgi:hypothetical protein